KPASASSMELSTTSYTRWCRPAGPVDPMYIAGRLRTASSPSRTLILSAEYSSTSAAVPWPLLSAGTPIAGLFGSFSSFSSVRSTLLCFLVWLRASDFGLQGLPEAWSLEPLKPSSHPHRHDHVGVVVAFGSDRGHHRLTHF